MEDKKGGMSEADNKMIGQALMLAVAGVVAILLLTVTPIIVGGFLIGLIWYGALIADGEANGERRARCKMSSPQPRPIPAMTR